MVSRAPGVGKKVAERIVTELRTKAPAFAGAASGTIGLKQELGEGVAPAPVADAGILRADLDDPDARILCTVWIPMLCRALEERPMKNAGMRLATVTPIGAFPLIDYLIVTSRDIGEGLERLARYLRIAEAPSIPYFQEGEDPIRVLFEGRDTPMSAEFSVTLNVLHFREETEDRFRAAYASFSHTPDDVADMPGVVL